MKTIARAMLGLTLICGGCSFSNHSFVRDDVATLPDGGAITVEAELVQKGFSSESKPPVFLWRKPLSTVPIGSNPPHAFEQEKILAVKGDQEAWFRENRERGRPAETHVSADGGRVWILRDGRAVASFDYAEGVAVLGTEGQPAWAVGAESH